MANDTEVFEGLLDGNQPDALRYKLSLYITGTTPNSKRAVENVKAICEQYLKDRYDLEIIDIYQQPALAEAAQIVAAPTLIKHTPYPLRRLIGDMSDTRKALAGLDISEHE